MDKKKEEFLARLRETFRVEAAEHLEAITAGLLAIERAGDAERAADRRAHLPGGPFPQGRGAVGEPGRRGGAVPGAGEHLRGHEARRAPAVHGDARRHPSRARRSRGHVRRAPAPRRRPRSEGTGATGAGGAQAAWLARPPERSGHLGRRPAAPLRTRPPRPSRAAPAPGRAAAGPGPAPPRRAETVRVSTQKLGAILLEAEELVGAKIAGSGRAAELRALAADLANWNQRRVRAGGAAAPRPGRHDGRVRAPRVRDAVHQDARELAAEAGRRPRIRTRSLWRPSPTGSSRTPRRCSCSPARTSSAPCPRSCAIWRGSRARRPTSCVQRRGHRDRSPGPRRAQGPAHPPAAQLRRSRHREAGRAPRAGQARPRVRHDHGRSRSRGTGSSSRWPTTAPGSMPARSGRPPSAWDSSRPTKRPTWPRPM